MSPSTITLLFLLFAVVMFVFEKIPLGLTSMIVCCGLVVTGVLDIQEAFTGFIDSNVILFVAMFIVGGALFETGMANKIGGVVTKFAKSERMLIVTIMVIVGFMSGVLSFMQRSALRFFQIRKHQPMMIVYLINSRISAMFQNGNRFYPW